MKVQAHATNFISKLRAKVWLVPQRTCLAAAPPTHLHVYKAVFAIILCLRGLNYESLVEPADIHFMPA